jgi:hypothetical protein
VPRLLGLIPLVVLLAVPSSAQAAPIGVFAFDLLAPGEHTFSLTNFSGPSALPPEYPSLTEALLVGAHVDLMSDQGPIEVDLGAVGAGPFVDVDGKLIFPDTLQFTSAVLTATLSPLSLDLADGSTFAALPQIVATLLPSAGGFLQAGVDFVIIDALAAPGGPPVPEPSAMLLILVGVAALARSLRRTRRSLASR